MPPATQRLRTSVSLEVQGLVPVQATESSGTSATHMDLMERSRAQESMEVCIKETHPLGHLELQDMASSLVLDLVLTSGLRGTKEC